LSELPQEATGQPVTAASFIAGQQLLGRSGQGADDAM
jgi:hypothetical protein